MKYFVITPIWDYDGCGGELCDFEEKEKVENFINEHLSYINKNTGFSDTVFKESDFTVIYGKEIKVDKKAVIRVTLGDLI